MTGLYLGLEGIEGAGKSTVAAAVKDLAGRSGIEVVLVREPGGTRLGEDIRHLLLRPGEMVPWAEAALFAAQRAQLVAEVVRPALARGAWVVSDRTYYSSLAYQGAGRELGIDRVRALNEMALDGVVPDLVVVLEVDTGVGLGRQVEADRIGGSGEAFQATVAAAYRRLAREEPDRVVLVDGSGEVEKVARGVVELARSRWSG